MEESDRQDIHRQIEEIREIVERNHEMIQSINRTMFWRRVMSIIYWVIIIGLAVGAFYFLQPYVDNLLEAYGQIKEGLNAIPQAGA